MTLKKLSPILPLIIIMACNWGHAATKAVLPDTTESRIELNTDEDILTEGLDFIPTIGISSFSLGSASFNINGKDAEVATASRQGFVLGGLANIGETRRVFETGFLYYQAGSELNFTPSGLAGTNGEVELEYLAIPLIGKFYFSDRGEGFFAKAGVYNSFLLGKTVRVNGRKINSDKIETRSFDMLATVGVGGIFALESGQDLSFDLVYQSSLPEIESTARDSFRNEGFLLTMGMML